MIAPLQLRRERVPAGGREPEFCALSEIFLGFDVQ